MFLEGWRSVASSLLANAPLTEILITGRIKEDAEIMTALEAHVQRRKLTPLRVYEISEKAARRISSVETNQGIFAVADIQKVPLAAFESMQRILILDGVQDPGNVGTIIRTAAWFGIEGVLASVGTADFYNPKVIRSTMGGVWDIKLARVPDLATALGALKQAGVRVAIADLRGTALQTWRASEKTALVIGGEAHGVSGEVKWIADESVTIAGMQGGRGTESLNAGMAAGIIMHHWVHAGS